VRVTGGVSEQTAPKINGDGFIVKKGCRDRIETRFELAECVDAPLTKGQKLGEVIYTVDGIEAARRDVCADEDIPRINLMQMFIRNLNDWITL
ncbi:MAG: hypothetical protein Q4E94_00105, partial [Clostridia bacterium]|nr:hypothetical protein [Clostridia bacterium]